MRKLLLLTLCTSALLAGFFDGPKTAKSTSGVSASNAQAQLQVKLNSKGNTLEQQNIIDSYKVENTPGAIKHLYIISNFTGKVLIYSTVMGKVTDNAKGLQPSKVVSNSYSSSSNNSNYMVAQVHGKKRWTNQVMQESGTFGSSSPYVYWFDTKGIYHKQWLNTSATIHVSNQPLPISASGELVIKFQ